MKNISRIAAVILVSCLVSAQASALIMVCWPYTHNCMTFEGGCEDWYGGGICFLIGTAMFNPNEDFIQSKNGTACIVQGAEKIPISSEQRNNSLARINARYAKYDLDDPKVKQQIEADYAYVLQREDRGTVSKKQLTRMSKATGLRIY